jgi:hypothetical protein
MPGTEQYTGVEDRAFEAWIVSELGARLCTWSTGSRSWPRVEEVVLAEGCPDSGLVVPRP